MMPRVSIVIPLFNEEESILPLIQRLRPITQREIARWQIVFVDDGSLDGTRQRLLGEVAAFNDWKFVRLSRNFGQQAAYRAGLGR